MQRKTIDMNIVDGFEFETAKEAEQAQKELSGIRYIKQNTDMKNPDVVYKLYLRLNKPGTFSTPVGMAFLVELQEYLHTIPYIKNEEIRPIYVPKKQENRAQKKKKESYKKKYHVALFFTIVLTLVIVSMFTITYISGHAMYVVDYENEVIDRYENWQKELEEREKAVEEREKALDKTEAQSKSMDNIKILVVDDESRMRKLVHDFLTREGYAVVEAADGEEALDIFYSDKEISLIVLDVMMPKINGWEVCREIRKISKLPIIMLTAKGDESDELNGFEIGADEYISKPFSPKILVARVTALLRRANKIGETADIREAGGIVMDKTAHTVAIDGQNIDLSVKEFELLDYFMNNRGIALSRERILDSVWSYDYFGDARTIDTHVKKLRSKMGAKGDYIKTVWGVGYKFEI